MIGLLDEGHARCRALLCNYLNSDCSETDSFGVCFGASTIPKENARKNLMDTRRGEASVVAPLKHGPHRATRVPRGRRLALMLVVVMGACGPVDRTAWESPVARDHPLAGRIWDVGNRRFIAPSELAARLAASRFSLLGERHDNPDHHALQARLLRAMIAAGRRPAVGFEMLSTDHTAAIARYLAQSPRSAAGLGDAVSWTRSGWPAWRLYEPIAQAALDATLPIVATNLSRVASEAIRRNGLAGLSSAITRQLGLDEPLAPETRDAMRRELAESHCGHAQGLVLERMVDVQWARDARMAEALARGGQRDGALLIAGTGHVRRDRGVPAHLRRRVPGALLVSLAFLEVETGADAPAAYAARFDGALPFDYVWFTPRIDDVDPCEKFRAPLENIENT